MDAISIRLRVPFNRLISLGIVIIIIADNNSKKQERTWHQNSKAQFSIDIYCYVDYTWKYFPLIHINVPRIIICYDYLAVATAAHTLWCLELPWCMFFSSLICFFLYVVRGQRWFVTILMLLQNRRKWWLLTFLL